MYIASRAAAASTASEIIVNIIIVTLSLIFKFVNPKNFLSYLARPNLFPFDDAKVRTISISCIISDHFLTKIAISLTSVNNLAVSLTYIKNNS